MLLGTNGSGKSTLLKLLAVVNLSLVRFDFPPGWLYLQNPDHQLVMPSVGADVALDWWRKIYRSARYVSECLMLCAVRICKSCNDDLFMPWGQKQRVAIAGALSRRCEVLLLDEPTASASR